jgi:hypothetical protein
MVGHGLASALFCTTRGVVGNKKTKVTAKTAPQRIEATIRRQHAVALRVQGGTFRAIAETMRENLGDTLGNDDGGYYDERDAYGDVKYELDRVNRETREGIDEIKRMELLRIDELWAVLWPYALQGDLASIQGIMALQNQRARYEGIFDKQESGKSGVNATTKITEVVIELRGVTIESESNQEQPADERPADA